MEAIKLDKKYTYADYYSWNDDNRWELIDGTVYAMAPGPSPTHQSTIGKLFWHLQSYLRDKSCEVFMSPLDVRLNADTSDNTVVQPDLIIVCDKSKIDSRGIVGAPDFVAEVLSPYTAKHDMDRKYKAYMKAGVKEYWIIDPFNKMLMAHILHDGKYEGKPYFQDDAAVPVTVLEDCTISLVDLFKDID